MKLHICLPLLAGIAIGGDLADFATIPGGSFAMGDHSGLGGGDTKHPSDEVPLHTVKIDSFRMEKFLVTNDQYARFLNAWSSTAKIRDDGGNILLAATGDTLYQTREAVAYSRIGHSNTTFSVLDGRGNHPVSGIRWKGAIAYCNWLSESLGLTPSYDLATGECDFTKDGIRLPTEAEWEYAALGGQKDPYPIFPWGNDSNTTGQYANWQNSGDPYEVGDYPWTTPVGFYDGSNHQKSEFDWPGAATQYQTKNAVNGYGLFDMSGNVWEFVNDWYANPYYQTSPTDNPTGPTEANASPMPDGRKYKGMRGGNWYNGAEYFGHGRISNRNPSYFRGPQDPYHPYYHIGFRVATRSTVSGASGIAGSKTLELRPATWFGDRLEIGFRLNSTEHVVVRIVGRNGRTIAFSDLGTLPSGAHTRAIAMQSNLPSGTSTLLVGAGRNLEQATLIHLSNRE